MNETRDILSEGLPYEKILRRNAFKYGACEENIDDILQDVFMVAWEGAEHIDPKNLKAYLVTISRNITLNIKGKELVRHKHAPRVRADEIERRVIQATDPETLLLQKERWPMLSDRERDLARLLYDVGLSKQEAAERLGISPRTVHRWLAKIKEKLSE
jgi:RNA polymerase sigma factor (sigma-70 family)